MPRYVILEHDHPHLHWDLMLETGSVLRTWRLDNPPLAQESTTATEIGDHRLAYLEYAGPITGERGTVKRWDTGVFESDARDEKLVNLQIVGSRLNGKLELKRLAGDQWNVFYFPCKGTK
jgi:hypothetical protein